MHTPASIHGGRRSRRWGVAAAALSLTLLTACSGTDDEEGSASTAEPIKIAVPIELTGAAAGFGVPYSTALKLAVEQVNARGGIESLDGAELELIIEDSQSDPNRAVQLLRQMRDEGAVAALGPASSGTVLAARPTLSDLGMPILSLGLDDQLTEDNDGTVFRMTDRLGGLWSTEAFSFIDQQVESSGTAIDSVGIVTISGSGGAASREALTKEAESRGWDVTAIEYDPAQTRDFSSIVRQLADADVDLVTGSQYPADSLLFAEAMALQSWEPESGVVWVGGGAILNSYVTQGGDAVDGWLAVSYSVPTDTCPAVGELAEEFEAEAGEPLAAHIAVAPASVEVIADALERAGSRDPEDLKEALATSEVAFCDGIYGLPGQVEFNETGDNVGWQPAVVQIVGGKQVGVYPESVATAEVEWAGQR